MNTSEKSNQYLTLLYKKTKGSPGSTYSYDKINSLLGLNDKEGHVITQYLAEKGYIDSKNTPGKTIKLTATGIDQAEGWICRSNRPYRAGANRPPVLLAKNLSSCTVLGRCQIYKFS